MKRHWTKPALQIREKNDEFGKGALALWLKPLGDVRSDVRIRGEARSGDVLYAERRPQAAHRRILGLP
jgi:hypothetical protein